MFDATKDDLGKILERAASGEIQLPEFQRDYVWGDDDVISLLASVANGYPIGAILTLEEGGEVSFKPRPLEGSKVAPSKVEEFLLDGQQRITSLNQSLCSHNPVSTLTRKNSRVKRFYYLDIEKAISTVDMEEAVVGVPEDKIIRTNFGRDVVLDLSTSDLEYSNRMFPLNQTFNSRDWSNKWRDYAREHAEDIDELEREFYDTVIKRIERYQVPIIKLSKNNGRAAICQVFEKVNVGGMKLDAFELVTAIYAGDDFDLREDWFGSKRTPKGRKIKIAGEKGERRVVSEIGSTDFLQACTILHTREIRLAKQDTGAEGKELPAISCKRDALLRLPLTAYKKHADDVQLGFQEASRFLNERKIFRAKDVPYPPQLVTLSSVFAILGKDGRNDAVKSKIDRWFWSTTFGELYGSASESRIAMDVPELVSWCQGGDVEPRSVSEAYFQKQRLDSLRTKSSAAYKGLHALLMNEGCLDFVNGSPADLATFFEDGLEIHHIFPQDWCKKNDIAPKVYNSIINKTPLSKRTNIRVSGDAPSKYLKHIKKKDNISEERLDEILRTHLIDPELMRADKFQEFYDARASALSKLVASAMRKPVVYEAGTNEPEEENTEADTAFEEVA